MKSKSKPRFAEVVGIKSLTRLWFDILGKLQLGKLETEYEIVEIETRFPQMTQLLTSGAENG